jgi:hypothetical protein
MFTPTMQHVGQIGAVGDTYVFGLARHDVGQDQTDTRKGALSHDRASVERERLGTIRRAVG